MQTNTKHLLQRRIRGYTRKLAEIERFIESGVSHDNPVYASDDFNVTVHKYWKGT